MLLSMEGPVLKLPKLLMKERLKFQNNDKTENSFDLQLKYVDIVSL